MADDQARAMAAISGSNSPSVPVAVVTLASDAPSDISKAGSASLATEVPAEASVQSEPPAADMTAPTSPQPAAFQPSREADSVARGASGGGRRRSVVESRRTGKAAVTDFFYGKLLGEGAFARVLHAAHRDTGAEFAVKIVDKRQIARLSKQPSVMMERNVMGAARHHCITRLIYTFQTRDELFFAMDLCRGQDLFCVIKHFRKLAAATSAPIAEDDPAKDIQPGAGGMLVPLGIARFYMAQCVCALEYLHSQLGVVHLDFKPENVLLDERGHIKLADFGTAKAETLPTRVKTAKAAAAVEIARSEASSRASNVGDGDDSPALMDTPMAVGPPSAIGRSVSSGNPGKMPSHRSTSSAVSEIIVMDRHRDAARKHATVVLAAALDHAASKHASGLAGDAAAAHDFVGTAEYVSPEMVTGQEPHAPADLWALGCTLYQLATGKPPFTGPTEFAILQSSGDYAAGTGTLDWPDTVPGTVRSLTEALLRGEPSRRLGAGGLVGVGVKEVHSEHSHDEFNDANGPRREDRPEEAEPEATTTACASVGVNDYSVLKAHPFFEGVDWSVIGTTAASAPWIPPQMKLHPPSSPSPLSWESLGEDMPITRTKPATVAAAGAGGDDLSIRPPVVGSAGRAGMGHRSSDSSSASVPSGTTPRHPLPTAEPKPSAPAGSGGWVTRVVVVEEGSTEEDEEDDDGGGGELGRSGSASLSVAAVTDAMAKVLPGSALPRRLYRDEYWSRALPEGFEVVMFGRQGKKRGWFSRVLERDVVLLRQVVAVKSDDDDGGGDGSTDEVGGGGDMTSSSGSASASPSDADAKPASDVDGSAPLVCRLIYFDPSTRALRGEITWDDDVAVANSDDIRWTLTGSSGSYQMNDWTQRAARWVACIAAVVSERLAAKAACDAAD